MHGREARKAMSAASPDAEKSTTAFVTDAKRHRPYPAYCDSGVEWLGKIPAHWDVKRLKSRFRVVNGSTPRSMEPTYWDGAITWITPEDLGGMADSTIQASRRNLTETGLQSCGASLVPAGSLVLSTRAPIGYLAIAGVDLCTNQGCRSLVFRDGLSRRYPLYHLLIARPALVSLGQGSTFMELPKDRLETIPILQPSPEEQHTIAAFLDRETSKIDALVAKKERLIKLLQEKRTALITRTVTKGLDPDAPMKDSEVTWLAQLPTHWSVRRLKRISREISVGVVVNPSSYISEEGVPFVYGSDIREGSVAAEIPRKMSFKQNTLLSKSRLNAGDLVMVRVGAPGVTAVISPDLEGANCASVVIVRRENSFDSNWLCYVMNSRIVRHQVTLVQYGAAQEQFNVAHAVEFMVPTPPLGEQNELSAFLDRETAKIDDLIANIRKSINRFNELRTALISAAVTGKIDVRETPA